MIAPSVMCDNELISEKKFCHQHKKSSRWSGLFTILASIFLWFIITSHWFHFHRISSRAQFVGYTQATRLSEMAISQAHSTLYVMPLSIGWCINSPNDDIMKCHFDRNKISFDKRKKINLCLPSKLFLYVWSVALAATLNAKWARWEINKM